MTLRAPILSPRRGSFGIAAPTLGSSMALLTAIVAAPFVPITWGPVNDVVISPPPQVLGSSRMLLTTGAPFAQLDWAPAKRPAPISAPDQLHTAITRFTNPIPLTRFDSSSSWRVSDFLPSPQLTNLALQTGSVAQAPFVPIDWSLVWRVPDFLPSPVAPYNLSLLSSGATVALSGRMQAMLRSSAGLSGVVALTARVGSVARSSAGISGKVPLSARAANVSAAQPKPSGSVGLAATSKSKASSPVTPRFSVALSGILRASTSLRSSATGKLALSARALSAAFARVVVSLRSKTINPNYVTTALARNRIMIAPTRQRVIIGVSNMSKTPDLRPAIDADGEQENVFFDYSRILVNGATLTNIVSVTCAVFTGTDPTPSSRILSAPAITTSSLSNRPNTAVAILVGNMLAGCTYRLTCIAQTSDGQTLSLWSRISAQAPD